MRQVIEADPAMRVLKQFIGKQQLRCIRDGIRGEEGEYFIEKVIDLAAQIKSVPKLYAQDGLGNGATVYLHYFRGNQDLWFTELDPKELLGFGWANMGDDNCAEFGYTNIADIVADGRMELDMHWQQKTLYAVKGITPPAAEPVESIFDLIEN